MLFRVRHTDVLEHIAASDFVSLLAAHSFLPGNLFGLAQSLLDQLHVPAWRFPPDLRFLLEGVKDVYSPCVLQGVHGAEGITTIVFDDFQDACSAEAAA